MFCHHGLQGKGSNMQADHAMRLRAARRGLPGLPGTKLIPQTLNTAHRAQAGGALGPGLPGAMGAGIGAMGMLSPQVPLPSACHQHLKLPLNLQGPCSPHATSTSPYHLSLKILCARMGLTCWLRGMLSLPHAFAIGTSLFSKAYGWTMSLIGLLCGRQ